MTEVPFMCFSLIAIYFSIRKIKAIGTHNILGVAIFSIGATLIRQPGVLIPLVLFIILFLMNIRVLSLKRIVVYAIPFILSMFALKLYELFRASISPLSNNYGLTGHLLESITNGALVKTIEDFSYEYFALWGLFLLPVIFLFVFGMFKRQDLWIKLISLVIAIKMSYDFLPKYINLFMGNTFQNFSFGIIILRIFNRSSPARIGTNDWENLQMTAMFGGVIILWALAYRLVKFFYQTITQSEVSTTEWVRYFGLVSVLGYFSFLMLHEFNFDRYSLTAVPFIILVLAPLTIPRFKIINIMAVSLTISLGIVSSLATHDQLSWNAAYWKGIRYNIDHLHIPLTKFPNDLDRVSIILDTKKMQVDSSTLDNEYTFSFDTSPDYIILAKFKYERFMPIRTDTVYILQKKQLKTID